jgi:hypothetical protein
MQVSSYALFSQYYKEVINQRLATVITLPPENWPIAPAGACLNSYGNIFICPAPILYTFA